MSDGKQKRGEPAPGRGRQDPRADGSPMSLESITIPFEEVTEEDKPGFNPGPELKSAQPPLEKLPPAQIPAAVPGGKAPAPVPSTIPKPPTAQPAQTPPPAQVRTQRRLKRKRRVWSVLYVLYVIGVIAYFGLLAKDRYVSQAKFVVTRGGETGQSGGAMSLMVGTSQAQQDAYTAIAYLLSIDMLRWLETEAGIDIRSHFADADYDYFYQLSPDARIEDLQGFYQDRVSANFDDVEGIVTMEVEGFTPDFARELASAILERSEEYLNELNRHIADRRLVFVMEELDLSEIKLEEAREELISFQNTNLTVDPEADIKSRLELIQDLKKEKVFKQAEQIRLTRESPLAPRIRELEAEISAIDSEMERESKELTGEGPDQLNQLFAEFSKLNQDIAFATERYGQSLSVVEEVRVQTLQQHRFLSVVQKPFLPEDSVRPARFYWAVTFAILGLMALQIIRLAARTVAEHR